MYTEISNIKTAAKAEALFNALQEAYTQRVGSKKATHADNMFQRGCEFKANGLAWWKARCKAVAGCLVSCQSTVNHFIPASPETEAWGGFLGGERVIYTDKKAEADAEAMILDRIAGL